MNCRKVISLLSAYVDGELSGNDMLMVRRHLSECESCSKEHASISQTKYLLSQLKTASPRDELVNNILDNLDSAPLHGFRAFLSYYSAPLRSSMFRTGLAAVAGCFLLFVVIAGPNLMHFGTNKDNSIMFAAYPNTSVNFEKMPASQGIPYCVSLCASRSGVHKMPNMPKIPYDVGNEQSVRVIDKTESNTDSGLLSLTMPNN